MKKHIIVLLSAIAVCWNGCTNLDEEIFSAIPPELYYQTEEQFLLAMVPVYSSMRAFTNHSSWWDLEETTDIAVTPVRAGSVWFDGGIYIRLHQHTWGESDVHLNNIWVQLFNGVNHATRVIDEIEKATFAMEGAERYIAEMKTARAFFYYLLCETFGNVPIIDRMYEDKYYLPETAPRKEVFEFIESEITENLDLLWEDKATTYGRFNRWNALGILARLYINAESWIGTPMYDKCLTACEEIIRAQKYDLDADFSTPFCVENELLSNENMFVIPFDEVNTAEDQIYMMARKTLHWHNMYVYDMQKTWVDGGGCGVPSFFDNYVANDKRLEKTWLMGQQYFPNGDEVFTWDWIEPGNFPLDYTRDIPSVDKGDANMRNGYRFHKYEIKLGMAGAPDNDYVIMRYAEILMMKAECLLRTGGSAQDAADLVNFVRNRAFDPADMVELTPAELQATVDYYGTPVQYGRLLQELGVEFALEGLRRSQLIRFDDCFTKGTWWDHQPTNNPNRNLMLIPLAQLNNNNKLQQNPR